MQCEVLSEFSQPVLPLCLHQCELINTSLIRQSCCCTFICVHHHHHHTRIYSAPYRS